jgi:acyl-coenzyme A synthetase/AMP-(fatty) acid ligase
VQTCWSRYGPRTYLVGDAARRDADGYLWIIGRIDDVINVSGHRQRIIWSDELPKTRSAKIMRRLPRDIADGRELGDVTTLRDPSVMEALAGKVAAQQD